ncbi:MAG: methylated-DNA--[protein]-cysteine S-methyltransferase [Desulfofustis sp.]|nr:methylated-DNA--[protein]-cysteine S-methyltransferase [Desulfofustis sp.]
MSSKQPLRHIVVDTMVGPLTIGGDERHIRTVRFGGKGDGDRTRRPDISSLLLDEARSQLDQYFKGSRTRFDLPLLPAGTDFQKRVWRALSEIGYGQVLSYGELAVRLGNVHLARAVGQAANRNPLPIFIPCHRLVGTGGWIGGFAPGEELKRVLLAHEGARGAKSP